VRYGALAWNVQVIPPSGPITPGVWQDLNSRTDEDLMAALASGCHDAVTVLFDRYSRLVFRVAERILRNPQEAEEVLQTVFMTIFRMAAKFDPQRGGVKIWLLQYAYSHSLRRKHQLNSRYFYATEEIESVISELSGRGSAGPSELSAQEASRLVHQALELVDEKQRRTIELTYYEGLTAGEIAERTGESVVTVRHSLYRGLAKLRERLESGRPKGPKTVTRRSPFREGGIADARA
jgi:RNA polymerase sigma-70 factor (ECF subfamily)